MKEKHRSVDRTLAGEESTTSGFLTLKRRQYSVGTGGGKGLSGFRTGRENVPPNQNFLYVFGKKKAGKVSRRRGRASLWKNEHLTCQGAIKMYRRNYKKKRGLRMKRPIKPILKAPCKRRNMLGRSESVPSETHSKLHQTRAPRGRPQKPPGRSTPTPWGSLTPSPPTSGRTSTLCKSKRAATRGRPRPRFSGTCKC